MITSYSDTLTFPLVTLGFPLIVCLYLDEEKTGQIKNLFKYSIFWAIGYVWMWASKWLLTDIFTDNNTINDALQTVMQRTDKADSNLISGFLSVIKANISPYANWSFFICVAISGLLVLFYLLKNKNNRINISNAFPFLIIVIYPFAWWFLTQNQSSEHWVFTCRIFSISIFAILASIESIIKKSKDI